MIDTPHSTELFTEENAKAEEAITANNFTEAATQLVCIIGKDPENARAFNNMGIISWSQKNWNDAYVMFLKSVTLSPCYSDALTNLFDAALKLKKIGEIQSYFEKACLIDPENEEIVILRDSMLEQGDAIYKSKRALTIGIYNPTIEAAKMELESGNLVRAMELFLLVNDTDGPDATAFCGLGIISFYQERYQDAFVLFIESIKLNPTDIDTFLNMADSAKKCNRLEDAQKVYATYLKEFPELASIANHFSIESSDT